MSFPVITLHIITSLDLGGAESMLDKLTERSDHNELAVISLTNGGQIGERIAKRGIQVWALGLNGSFQDAVKIWRLYCYLRRVRPKIVQTWLYHADFLGGLVARIAGIKCVVWNIRNSGAALHKLSFVTRLIVKINGILSWFIPLKILCCSQVARRNHVKLGFNQKKIKVIPNGFDINKFSPNHSARLALCVQLGLDPALVLVGLVARFDPQKNHSGFVEAAAHVLRVRSDVRFIMVGLGVDDTNTELRRWIDEANISTFVYLLGQRIDIPLITAAFDVAVNSSLGEGFPNAVGEAMACGVPCVVTDVGDSADIVGNTGRVAIAGNSTALAEQILQVINLSNEERNNLGQAARRRIAEHYEISNVVREFQSFYSRLIEEQC